MIIKLILSTTIISNRLLNPAIKLNLIKVIIEIKFNLEILKIIREFVNNKPYI
jgi:hypothetical protein